MKNIFKKQITLNLVLWASFILIVMFNFAVETYQNYKEPSSNSKVIDAVNSHGIACYQLGWLKCYERTRNPNEIYKSDYVEDSLCFVNNHLIETE